MTTNTQIDALKEVSQIAALSGLKGAIDQSNGHFSMGFNLPGNRSQNVFVRHTGQTPAGKQIVTFYSPCLVVKKGLLSGISKDQAIALLRRNENVMFARFGMWEDDKRSMIVASVDHILETLDPEEFEATAWYVAYAADAYEQEHGQDTF
jgi:hypothetical protein